MANSKLIVVEGPQGAGKTTVTDFLRYSLSYTNLYRLCGTSDSSAQGKKKAEEMYINLLEYIKKWKIKVLIWYLIELFLQKKIIVDWERKIIHLLMYTKNC